MNLPRSSLALATVLVLCATAQLNADLKRSRTEDLMEVRASNTEGFSNIWAGADVHCEYRDNSLSIEPKVCGRIGLASLLHLSGSTGVPKGRTLGTTEVHAQITLPGNDRLRFIGMAASGDMLLTTRADPESDRPPFVPYLGFTALIDLDLIAKFPWLPLKLYVNATNLAGENIMLYFTPVSLLGGIEYKGSRHSYFASGQAMVLKQNNDIELTQIKSSGEFDQFLFYVYPGLRYRISDRISLVGRGRLLLLSIGDSPYLPQRMLGVSIGAEIPLLFKDTDAEALRSLIFVERRRKSNQSVAKAKAAAAQGQGRMAAIMPADSLATGEAQRRSNDYFKQREELRNSRKKVLEDMEKIEEMLE